MTAYTVRNPSIVRCDPRLRLLIDTGNCISHEAVQGMQSALGDTSVPLPSFLAGLLMTHHCKTHLQLRYQACQRLHR